MYCVKFYKRVCCHLEHMRGTGVEGDKSGEGTMQRMARQGGKEDIGKEDKEKEDEGKNRHNPCPRMQIATAVPGSVLGNGCTGR